MWGIRRLAFYQTARRTANDPEAMARLEAIARVLSNRASEPAQMAPEKHLFGYSVFYLFALFTALVADRWIVL